jgi:competence protein ComEC
LPARAKRYAVGLAATDLVASLATAPFALYHFNRVAVFSLPANVLAMPLMAFWIMPAAVVGLVLTPLGLDGFAWIVAAKGVDVVLAVGAEVSSWPNAVRLTAQWPTAALIALCAGALWLALAMSPLRLVGVLGIPAAWIIAANATPPDVFIAASGQNAGVVHSLENGLAVIPYTARRDRFSARVWAESVGADPDEDHGLTFGDVATCGGDACLARVNGASVSVIEDPMLLAEDCDRADLVVAFFPASGRDWRACDATLIDKRSVWRRGAHAVWIDAGEVRVKTVSASRGARPWTGMN